MSKDRIVKPIWPVGALAFIAFSLPYAAPSAAPKPVAKNRQPQQLTILRCSYFSPVSITAVDGRGKIAGKRIAEPGLANEKAMLPLRYFCII